MSTEPLRQTAGKPFSFRLTSEEIALIERDAAAANLSVGEFARRAALRLSVDQQPEIRRAVARLLQAVEIAAESDADPSLRKQLKAIAQEGLRHLARCRP